MAVRISIVNKCSPHACHQFTQREETWRFVLEGIDCIPQSIYVIEDKCDFLDVTLAYMTVRGGRLA
jgi:hypothetical protein